MKEVVNFYKIVTDLQHTLSMAASKTYPVGKVCLTLQSLLRLVDKSQDNQNQQLTRIYKILGQESFFFIW